MRSQVFWFTGVSGAGKTTVASKAQEILKHAGVSVQVIDGDEVRATYPQKLGFSVQDILKNSENVVKLCQWCRHICPVTFVATISPLSFARQEARDLLSPGFHEVYFDVSMDLVAQRDPKGLYAKARKGIITDLVGYSMGATPYQVPQVPDLRIVMQENTPSEDSAQRLVDYVLSHLDGH